MKPLIYRIIPKTYADLGFGSGWTQRITAWLDPRQPLWALFGNDEDTPCGEASHYYQEHGFMPGFKSWWWWWRRNPFHNLFTHVIAWPFPSAVVFAWNARAGWQFYWVARVSVWWQGDDESFSLALLPPDLQGRGLKLFGRIWELYAGWHQKLGFAFRKFHSTPA